MPLRITRRQAIQGAVAALATGTLPPASAQAALPTFTPPAAPQTIAQPRGLAAVVAALGSGVGVYVGNDWADWDDAARQFAMAKIRAWGFDFVCPKVGGYGRTCYQDEAHLRGWAESARGIGLGFVPFLYTIPETGDADARICAQMARTVGIACVDMEDEWGSAEKGAVPGYQGARMASFGRIYRAEAGALPIIVTGYGDPITRFGPAATAFPNAEMAAWMDVYSPQWYIGVYSRYKKGGVGAALDWGKAECRQALGTDFPTCPSVDLSCSYTPDGLFPLADTRTMMETLRAYQAPIFVWEYGMMTPAHAESLLGPPVVRNVRVGRSHRDSLVVVWDTHVPARSVLTCRPPKGETKTSRGETLELTHSGGAEKLSAGTAYLVTAQSSTGGGTSPEIPLTVATAPTEPGIFVQSALAARAPLGHVVLTLLVTNSADTEAADVQVTSLAVEGGAILSPIPLPYPLGALGKRDWQASTRDRTGLEVVVTGLPATTTLLTLHIGGTATDGKVWAATLPVTLPV